jgi:hypothetical protein
MRAAFSLSALSPFLQFDRAAGFLPSRPQISDAAARKGAVKAGRHLCRKAPSGVSRPRLDGPEHGGTIGRSGRQAGGISAEKFSPQFR